MTQRQYFKDKADKDKLRYLTEQRQFYDEVEQIGNRVGTVTTKEGQIIVAPNQSQNTDATLRQALKLKSLKVSPEETNS
jgi:hypothetical protein